MRWFHFLPLGVFLALGIFLYLGLFLDPHQIPTALGAKPVPDFSLPALDGQNGPLSSSDLKAGDISLVNVFASWCVPCRAEHPALMQMKARGITVHGMNYKDAAQDARAFLGRLGNPYTKIGADMTGRIAIDWGVYGVPETFIVTGDGHIACKHVGPLTADDLEEKIYPALMQLQQNPKSLPSC